MLRRLFQGRRPQAPELQGQHVTEQLPRVSGGRGALGSTLLGWPPLSGPRLPPQPKAASAGERRLDATSPLFRERALQRHRRGDNVAEVLEISPRLGSALALVLSSAVLCGIGFAVFGRIDVVSTARGVMRPLDGVVAVAAEVDGLVAQVHVSPGQKVSQGQPLLELDSAPIRAQLLEAERRRDFARQQLAQLQGDRAGLRRRARELLDQRAQLIASRMTSQLDYIDRLRSREVQVAALEEHGVMLKREADAVRDDVGQAQRSLLDMRSQEADARFEDNRLLREHAERERDWLSRLQEAEAQVEGARLLLRQTVARAPLSGTIESLLVRVGEQVRPATPIGRLIPEALSDRVVVFIPERDRAFVKPGSRVRLSVDQLPTGEFGRLTGRVLRVARAIATRAEIDEVFGSDAALSGARFRVEVALVDDAKRRELTPYLRTGAFVTGHITLRRQRLIALLLGPLKELLSS